MMIDRDDAPVDQEFFDTASEADQASLVESFMHRLVRPLSVAERGSLARSFGRTVLRFERGGPDVNSVAHCLLSGDRVVHAELPKGFTMQDTGGALKNEKRAKRPGISAQRCLAPNYSMDAGEVLACIDFPYTMTRVYFEENFYRVQVDCGPLSVMGSTEALSLLSCLLHRKADLWKGLS